MGNKSSTNPSQIQSKPQGQAIRVPIKPLFPHSTTWRCANPADFAHISKLRPKLLSHIHFSNNEAQYLGSRDIKDLCRVLSNAKRLSNLQIEDSNLNSKQLYHILNSTNHLKKIKIYPNPKIHHDLSKSFIRMGRNKNLSELTVSNFKYEQGDDAYRIRKQLNHLRKLEFIDLNNEVLLSLQPLKSLKSAKISFRQNCSMKLPDLLSNLNKCDGFTELALDFQDSDSIYLQETRLWNTFFQKVQTLKNLTLFRSFSAGYDFSGFQVFPECFQFMKNLTALRVHLNISAQHPDQDAVFFIDFFFESLKSLPQLKKLELIIDGNYVVKNANIKNLASALGCLKNLHSLDLEILRLGFSCELVVALAKNIKNLSCLKHFKLKLTNNRRADLTYKAVKSFAKSLTRLPLKSLDLILSDQPIILPILGYKPKVPLLSALSSLKDLSSLHLDLSVFIPREWKNLYLSRKCLQKLTYFSVVVGQFKFANNFKGLSSFMLCLEVMPNLTTLKLKLSEIVSDQEVDIIVRNLDGYPNLRSLELSFQQANYLGEKSLDSLQKALVKLTKLEYLEVNLWRSRGFGDDVVTNFLDGFIALKRLKQLVVNFERPSIFSNKSPAWKNSLRTLKNCKYLTKVEINSVRFI